MLLEFYVEEISMEIVLHSLVKKILHEQTFDYQIYTHQGKPDLLRKLPNRLKAYRHRMDDWRVIVLIDRDNDDCLKLKQELENIASDAGLMTKTTAQNKAFQVINRIVIEELEAWFFGDIKAIQSAYPRLNISDNKKEFRDPDAIKGGTAELLERLLQTYHGGGLAKQKAAKDIARHMNPNENRSHSFNVFRDALLGLFE
jgi:hypothetical protein